MVIKVHGVAIIVNLAVNVCGFTPVKLIKDGILSDIKSIHRLTIDRAIGDIIEP